MPRQLDNLIKDRTSADILNETDKAFISYTDLNRIEQACSYLAGLLHVTITTKTWTMDEFRTETQMARIRSNIQTLLNAFYQDPNNPILPTVIKYENYKEANDIEQILYNIENMILNVNAASPSLPYVCSQKMIGNREVQ